jgi:S1-C subfamily serine protease
MKDTKSIQALEAFISRYKDTYYADLARLRMEELKKQQIGIAAPPSGPSSPHGWLGIKVGSVDDQIASRLSLRSTNGAVVMEVAPADLALLQV